MQTLDGLRCAEGVMDALEGQRMELGLRVVVITVPGLPVNCCRETAVRTMVFVHRQRRGTAMLILFANMRRLLAHAPSPWTCARTAKLLIGGLRRLGAVVAGLRRLQEGRLSDRRVPIGLLEDLALQVALAEAQRL